MRSKHHKHALLRTAAVTFLLAAGCTTDEPNEESSLTAPEAMMSTAAVSAYDIVKVDSMAIDGNLADWANVAAISMADSSGRAGGADNTATVKFAWNGTYLYAAYKVTDTELLAVQSTRDHGDIYKDDAIELYIDPQGDGAGAANMTATDYQFLANVREALGDNRGNATGGKDNTYNAASFLAKAAATGTLNASGTDEGYAVEVRISWSDLGITPAAGHFMRIDPAVDDRDGTGAPPVQYFDWAGLTTTFNNPSSWKDVQLVDPAQPPSEYDIVKVGSAGMTVDGNLNDWAGVASISMADDPSRGSASNSASVKLTWNDTYLYAAYNVTDTELLALQTTRDHGDIYKDDEVELHIDPQGDGASATSMTPTDYQFLANVRNAIGDNRGNGSGGKDNTYNATSFVAKAVTNGTLNAAGTDAGYTVELRISWTDLGVAPAVGKYMRIDPAVGDRDGSGPPPTQEFDWAGLALFNNPSGWKVVKLVQDNTAPAPPTNLGLTSVSTSRIDVSWTASTGTDVARYHIYRGTTGTPTLIDTVPGSPHKDSTLTASTSYTYQVAAVDAAGNESPKTAPASATTKSAGALGIPYGTYNFFHTASQTETVGTASFSLSMDAISAPYIISRINAARAKKLKLITNMTAGHDPYLTNGVFDMEKWKKAMDTYNTRAIKDSVAAAVRDGIIIGNSVMDEPNVSGLGDGNTWGPPGTMTKARVDSMCTYVKNIFPTLAVGVAHNHDAFEPAKSYRVCEFIVSQYSSRFGSVDAWRDAGLALAQRDGHAIAFSINILNGGIQAPRAPGKTDYAASDCPLTTTGGKGTYFPNCRMTAQQVRDFGKKLGVAGCAMTQWRYNDEFMAKPENQSAFADVAALLRQQPAKSCKRP